MIFLILASWLLGILALTAGRDLTCRIPEVQHMATPDRWFLRFWAGVSVLLGVLCVFAAMAPAKYFWLAALPYLGIRYKRVWRLTGTILTQAGWKWTAALVAFQLVSSVKWVELTSNFDSYFYHYQLIDWYGTYGAVKGLGLVHFRFAFSSAWYALAGAFDFGTMAGRTGNLPSFFVLSAGAAYVLALFRQAAVATRFWAFFFAGVLAAMPVEAHSTSADFGAAVLIGAAVWMLLAAPEGALEAPRYLWLPVLVAAGAATVKQQAIFAVAGLAILLLVRSWRTPFKGLGWLALACLPFAALTLMNFMTSGCLMTSVGSSCLDVPWGMSKWHMRDTAGAIRSYYAAADFAAWLGRERCAALLLALTVVGGAGLLRRSVRRPVVAVVFVTAAAGAVVCLWAAPTLRFATGYLWLVPALLFAELGTIGVVLSAAAICLARLWLPYGFIAAPWPEYAAVLVLTGGLIVAARTSAWRTIAIPAAVLVVFLSTVPDVFRRPVHPRPPAEAGLRWLFPVSAPVLDAGELQVVVRPGFRMYQTRPPNLSCFSGNLPCSYYDDRLVLLAPNDGIFGGFTFGPDSPRYAEHERSARSR